MRCLYCGKELALFKRLRGGEFCSDAHRLRYQEEYTQLALNRLLQANSSMESNDSAEPNAKAPLGKAAANGRETKEEVVGKIEPIESPAMKRRERVKAEEPTQVMAPPPPVRPAPEPLAPAARANSSNGVEASREIPRSTALPEHRQIAVAIEEPAVEPEGSSPAMAEMLVELPMPALPTVAEISRAEAELLSTVETVLPEAQETPAGIEGRLNFADPVPSVSPRGVDWIASRPRTVEIREFNRSAPVVEINLNPAGEMEFPHFEDPLEVKLDVYPPETVSTLWQESVREFALAGIAFEETARLDFAPTPWGEGIAADAITSETEETPAPPAHPARISLEASRMEPVRLDPVRFESVRPQSLQFEQVQIEPVFAERIAVKSDLADDIAGEPLLPEEPIAADTAQPPVPEAITKPEPVTLHGIAPSRGKPMQIFTSALPGTVEVQAPRQSSLPLRPVMVLGPEVSSPDVKASATPAIPAKQENRATGGKRKPEVRVVALPSKIERKAAEPKVTPVKSPEVKPAEVKPEAPVEAKANIALPETKSVETKSVETKPAAAKSTEPQKVTLAKQEPRKPEPEPVAAKPAATETKSPSESLNRPAPLNPAPPIPDLLGLPQLSLQNSQSAWSRIPVFLRIGIAAAVLAAVAGGIFLTSRGSGASIAKTKETPRPAVEVGPALATNAGWVQDWFTDPRGSKQARHVDILRGSLALRDYRLELEGQIDQGGIGWAFRANGKSFYAEKVAIVKPGLEPTIAMIRIAVVDGQEVSRDQIPLPMKVHLDTLYKIRVDAIGHRFTTWVQDQQVDEWTDSRIEAGGVGLYYDGGDSAHLKGTLNVFSLKEK